MITKKRRLTAALGLVAAASLALGSCGSGRTDTPTSGAATGTAGGSAGTSALVVGTTDKVTALDPAGAYDNGSYNVMVQVFPFLLGFPPGDPKPTPDAAQSCDFTSDPTVYECKLKPDLKFANGNPLDAEAVKFTFDRQVKINDPNGPASLLANLDSVTVKDPTTVEFKLKSANDVTFAQVLASPVGPLVDPKSFSADALTPDQDIVSKNAFGGPYTIKSYQLNKLVEFAPNPNYDGAQGKVANGGITLKYYTDPTNMRLEIADKTIDVATRSLTPTDIETLEKTQGVKVYKGPGGEERYIVFNMKTMPGDSDEQKLAVRKAMASLIDRDALSTKVYKGTYTPLYSFIPEGLAGANESLKDAYGDKPNQDEAKKFLSDAGVATPVTLNLQYNPDHYGTSSDQEYNTIKEQLEAGGLFKVNLQSTEWVTYSDQRTKDAYPVYQLGWFPDFPDPDNYLTPFFDKNNFINNHFESAEISALLDKERTTTDEAARADVLKQIQTELATKYLPTLPLLQGAQVAVGIDGVSGVDKTLDASFQFRFAPLSKG